ncbi:GLPGLI family protein [Chryseobacterium shigense]|uniref:GLPGLI family protein n=1 Tax=Chryseobacterium shigense TaxID=297244 RepID=A0A841N9Z0_9FLAO|nr:GLPGLI family protein [Chryseobacterium shigense]MBB6371521.1 GLPGLI family protein [Chryseobacterium shigense]
MKNLSVFLSLIVFSGLYSQTKRVIYEVKYRKTVQDTVLTKEFYHADLNKTEKIYYNRDFYVSDSLNKANNNLSSVPKLTNLLTMDNDSGNFTEYEFLGNDVIKRETQPRQVWTLSKILKKTDDFELQQATCTWGGREWIAWFYPESPITEGPYKFRGLPGLIFEVYDTEKNYHFKLIKTESYSITQKIDFFQYPFKQAILVDEARYKKLKTDYYYDPLIFINNGSVDFNKYEAVFLNDGTKITKDNKRQEIEKQRALIKKYNNPVELSNIIKYP